jgi:hypothetical protein
MNPHHLPRLQSLHHENPTKRVSLIRLAWPDIEKALVRGHTLKLIHSRLTEDGLHISYSLLSLCVRRLQGKESVKKHQHSRFETTKSSSDVGAGVPQRESLRTDKVNEPAPPSLPRNAPVQVAKECALLDPSELMAFKDNVPDGECFFRETVPDINELF